MGHGRAYSIRSIVNSYEFIQYIMYGNLASWPDWIATLVHFRLVLLLRHLCKGLICTLGFDLEIRVLFPPFKISGA